MHYFKYDNFLNNYILKNRIVDVVFVYFAKQDTDVFDTVYFIIKNYW